jgi:hypothetical protein
MSAQAASESRLCGARSGVVYALLLGLGVLDAAGYSLIAPVLPCSPTAPRPVPQ